MGVGPDGEGPGRRLCSRGCAPPREPREALRAVKGRGPGPSRTSGGSFWLRGGGATGAAAVPSRRWGHWPALLAAFGLQGSGDGWNGAGKREGRAKGARAQEAARLQAVRMRWGLSFHGGARDDVRTLAGRRKGVCWSDGDQGGLSKGSRPEQETGGLKLKAMTERSKAVPRRAGPAVASMQLPQISQWAPVSHLQGGSNHFYATGCGEC